MLQLKARSCMLLFALLSCEPLTGPDEEPEKVYTAADGMNGDYVGNWTGGQSDRNTGILSGDMKLSISDNSSVKGDIAPISGSRREVVGTVTPGGVLTATAAADTRGCVVAFTGQITTSADGATVRATASGSYELVQSSTCNTNSGSWTLVRK